MSLPEGELREAGAAKLLSVQLLARGTELTVRAKGRDEPLLHARGLLKAAAADDLTWFLDKDSNELVVGLCASDGGSWTGRLVGAGGAVEAP